MSAELEVEFLGSLPLDPILARCCDKGQDFLTECPDSPAVKALNPIIQSKFFTCFQPIFFNSINKELTNFFCFQKSFKNVIDIEKLSKRNVKNLFTEYYIYLKCK